MTTDEVVTEGGDYELVRYPSGLLRRRRKPRPRREWCKAVSPAVLSGNPMVVGGIRESRVGCRLPADHEGNHRGPSPNPEYEWWEWPK